MLVTSKLRASRLAPIAALALVILACAGSARAAAPYKPADFGTGTGFSKGASPSGVQSQAITPARQAAAAAAQLATVVNTAVCAAVYDQSSPGFVSDGAGGGFACWHDYRDGNLDVYAQRLDPQGVPQWVPDGTPVSKAAGHQWYPRSVADGTGGVIVVWQDYRAGGSDTTSDIYAQRLSADGIPLWTADGVVVCNQSGSQLMPTLIADGTGGALVLWVDSRGADRDLYAQRISAAGALQWAAGGVAVCAASGDQTNPSMVGDNQGGLLVAWVDARAGAAEVFAQRVTAGGSPSWTPNGVPVCTALGVCEAPVAASDGSTGLIVGWGDGRGANFDIYAQRLNGSGIAQWTANGVQICNAAGDQRLPAIGQDGAGGVFLSWQDARAGNLDIYAQRVGNGGAAAWAANGVAVCVAANNQVTPSIQPDPAGGVFIGWSDGRTPANEMDVYGQRLSGSGTPTWAADGVLLSDAANNQDLPRVIANGMGGAVVLWRDSRPGTSTDIYSQRVDAAGAVTGPCPSTTIALAPSVVVTTTSSPGFYDTPQVDFYWAGVGVRTDSSSDWDIEVFRPNLLGYAPYPNCFAEPVAASYASSGVDFVMGNFNINQTWPDDYGVRIARYSGTGSASLEWDAGTDLMEKDCGNGGGCGSKPANNWSQLLDVWDVFLFEGQTYTFDFTRSGDVKMALFEPGPGGEYFVPRSGAVFETSNRFTVFTVPGVYPPPPTLPTLRVYGVALINDGGTVASYTVRINTGASVGVEEGAVPATTALQSLRPNPSPGRVEIRYALAKPGTVGFQVFDMAGRAVSEIAPHARGAGSWSIQWDGRGSSGQNLAAGVYFVQMKVNGVGIGMSRLALVR